MRRGGRGDSTATCRPDWDYTSSPDSYTSTTKVTDKPMGKVIGKPYRGKPDLRFDEGTKGNEVLRWASGQMLDGHWRVSNTEFTNASVMH